VALLRKYEMELKKLRSELENRSTGSPDNNLLKDMAKEKKRLEEDR
jgi:hypothetical protein